MWFGIVTHRRTRFLLLPPVYQRADGSFAPFGVHLKALSHFRTYDSAAQCMKTRALLHIQTQHELGSEEFKAMAPPSQAETRRIAAEWEHALCVSSDDSGWR